MHIAYISVAGFMAAMAAFSGIAKLRQDPKVVRAIQVVGVPLKWFPLLAACEFAGALGLIVGIWLPWAGLAASIGLVIYFVCAVVAHLRVGDTKGLAPAAFMLILAAVTFSVFISTNIRAR